MSIITGTECGDPSGRSVAMWAMFGPAKSVRASSSSVVMSASVRVLDRLAIVPAEPVRVVRHGARDVIDRPETRVLPQPADVQVVVGRPVRIAALREDDIRTRYRRVDRGHHLPIPDQPPGGDVVDAMVQLL